MVRAKVFRQHLCAKFFSALELELFGSVKWVGLSLYSQLQNTEEDGTAHIAGAVLTANTKKCATMSLNHLYLHTARASTALWCVESKHSQTKW